jgi:hypothetical protein
VIRSRAPRLREASMFGVVLTDVGFEIDFAGRGVALLLRAMIVILSIEG